MSTQGQYWSCCNNNTTTSIQMRQMGAVHVFTFRQ